METSSAPIGKKSVLNTAPLRLHHNAYVVADQERTRAFYEDLLGLKLASFWIETNMYKGELVVLSHAMYSMQDGSCLAFFNFADEKMQKRFASPETQVFNHLALNVDRPIQEELLKRLEDTEYTKFSIEHGYCSSLYVEDPDGLQLEFTLDADDVDEINAWQSKSAHQTLKEWMNGRREPNNKPRETL